MDLKDQKFGIEIELTGISRRRAAEVAAAHFGTSSYYVGTYYDTYAAKDQQQREWKFMSDASIKAQRKEGKIKSRLPRNTGRRWSARSAGMRTS